MDVIATKIIAIGILTLPLTHFRLKKFKKHDPKFQNTYTPNNFKSDHFLSKTTYFCTNYSYWLKSAKLNTIPLLLNTSKKKLLSTLKKLNGVLLTGGSTKMFNSQNGPTKYLEIVSFIINFAKEQNKKGKYFLIWGTCLGQESVMNSLNMENNLQVVNNQVRDYMSHFKTFENSKLGSFLNIDNLFEKDIFYYYNRFGFEVGDFQNNYVFKNQTKFFATVKNGFSEFIGYIEFKDYPFFLPLFHMEKKKKIKNKDLDKLRLLVKKKMAEFIRHSIEKNSNNFLDQKELDALIDERNLHYKYCDPVRRRKKRKRNKKSKIKNKKRKRYKNAKKRKRYKKNLWKYIKKRYKRKKYNLSRACYFYVEDSFPLLNIRKNRILY